MLSANRTPGLPAREPYLSTQETSRASVETLLEEHGDYLYRFATARVGEPRDVEDLLQETFLAAHRMLDSFRGDSTIRTWLTAILKNKIRDYYKKAGREESHGEVESVDAVRSNFQANGRWKPEAGPGDLGTDPANLYERKEFMRVLEDCLKQLPKRMEKVFRLRELQKFETSEIRETLNISTSNLSVILHRARMQLASCLKSNWSHSIPG